ncbi:MAG: hypothetical protein LC667_19390 [Thioalkalivibrio sp.]|nr:hypothetical protein [Thioalkalivibrio sp.]
MFRVGKSAVDPVGSPLAAHWHQIEALRVAHGGHPYVVTTGTGSGVLQQKLMARDRKVRDRPVQRLDRYLSTRFPLSCVHNQPYAQRPQRGRTQR